jgi:hypothetical protein
MGVDHAFDIRSAHVDRTMDHVTGAVGLVFGRFDKIAVEIHLQQVRGGDLVEHQPHRVDQEMVRLSRNPPRIVRQDQIVPTEVGEQTIAGGEVDPYLPLLGTDVGRSVRDVGFKRVHLFRP